MSLSDISRERPVVIAGPTAAGKSALAMDLAARDGRVVVNADALQVHDAWRVLTARPSAVDAAAVPHALYGHVPRGAAYSVGHWLREVAPLLDRPVVVVGGTGLYLTALTTGLAPVPPIPALVRAEADARLAQAGLAAMLADLDAATAAAIDRANPARVQRAWEVLRATGRGLADWQRGATVPLLPKARAETLLVMPDRDALAARIDRRFLAMLDAGALDEVRAALPRWQPQAPWARAIGAAQLVAHLHGETTLAQAVAGAQAATRQYAKRQRTWFRGRMADWRIIDTG
ncbi:MAG: tRNA (adenosine(37)-N6)-dimethylallyltransferase MiaA [Gemmobacter sp.]